MWTAVKVAAKGFMGLVGARMLGRIWDWSEYSMARYALLLAVAMGVYLLATYMEKRVTPIIKTSSYYYPGGLLMRIRCWLMHPFNEERRAEEEFSEGWKWAGKHDDQ